MSDNFFKTPVGVIVTVLALIGAVAICSHPWWFQNVLQMIATVVGIIVGGGLIVLISKRILKKNPPKGGRAIRLHLRI
jgi:hypothetical protein